MSKSDIKTLSLFSGAGGLDLGFEQAGFNIVGCVEIEDAYCKTLERNKISGSFLSPITKIFCQDIREFDPSDFLGMGIDCIIGGPPCQTFSAAGRRAGGVIGTEDERGQLYSAYCKILKVLDPKVFVFENVYGLPGANGGAPWKEILNAFSSLGYVSHYEVLDAADYGVPQHRERLFLVGSKSGEFVFPMPTHGPDSLSGTPLVSVQNAILDIQVPNENPRNDLGGLYGHLLPDVPEGLNYAFFTAEMGHPEPVFAWRSKFHDLLYKVNRDEPCRTIKAQPGKFTGPFHWMNRHFTVSELKRLQTFPDDYDIVGSYSKVLEQIGNSVPPKLAFALAWSVKEQLFSSKKHYRFPLRYEGFSSTFRQRQRLRSKDFKRIAEEVIRSRYPERKIRPVATGKVKTLTYFVEYSGRFSRAVRRRKSDLNKNLRHARVELTEQADFIQLDYDAVNSTKPFGKFMVNVTGVKKYLPKYDRLLLSANIGSFGDLFHVWKEVEACLIERSKFYSLIDIYGHYANKGDAVDIQCELNVDDSSPIARLINFFSRTENCGQFFSQNEIWKLHEVLPQDTQKLVRDMRELRFDLRTPASHPIISPGMLICTYPFPLLSPRALVESRAVIIENENKIVQQSA